MAAKRQLLFVQGGGKGTHDAWDNKLVESLRLQLGAGYEVHYPRMPEEDNPTFEGWKPALERDLRTLPDGAIVVAHSVGATVLLGVLAKGAKIGKAGGLFLLATPFVGDGGWPSDELQMPSDLGAHLPPGVPIHFFHGTEDDEVPPAHVDLYARAVPQANVHRLPGRNHQLNDNLKEVAAAILSLDRPR